MSIKIGHASIDERGRISGGIEGDQTGKEICVRDWYNKPWNVYFECLDEKLASKAVEFMKQICADPDFGYDQNQRWTGYNAIRANGNKVAGARKGEFDCSSLIVSCYIFAGLNMTPDGYTGNLRTKLYQTGKFKIYTDAEHINSDKLAKKGGIYLREGHHVAMALEDAEKPKAPFDFKAWVKKLQKEIGAEVDGIAGEETLSKTPTLNKGDKGEVVELVQELLVSLGYDLGDYGKNKDGVDGSFGSVMKDVVEEFQKKDVGLENPDGEITSGNATWKKLLRI